MKHFITILLLLTLASFQSFAGPYAPRASQPGSTAVHMDDPNIVAWATGWTDYFVGSDCTLQWQTPENSIGKAEGIVNGNHMIVTLGRAGEITLIFDSGIGDGDGYDFAVFENAVNDYFLELGFVEVSSDGENYFRIYNDSLTPSPITAFGIVDTTNITGLAGKYIHSYGTPFDLAGLRGISPLLDVDNIGYVRIVDIVGDGTCQDSSGKVIYDPYATEESAGFDLDAIAVMNTRAGDLDSSGGVDETDLAVFVQAWSSGFDDDNFNPDCDVSYPKNGVIDLNDFAVFSKQFNLSSPAQ